MRTYARAYVCVYARVNTRAKNKRGKREMKKSVHRRRREIL